MGYQIDVDPNDLEEKIKVYLYLYSVVEKLSSREVLRLSDLEGRFDPAVSPVAGMLTELFNKHSIDEIPLGYVKKSFDLANNWLLSDEVSEAGVQEIVDDVEEQRTRLKGLVDDIYAMDHVDEHFIGGPLIIAVIGNSRQLAELTLEFSQLDDEVKEQVQEYITEKVVEGIKPHMYQGIGPKPSDPSDPAP